jgi:hypothetical protein
MKSQIKYYYTTFGDVYAGFEFFHRNHQQLKIIIQADKLREYQDLNYDNLPLEKIKEYANVFPETSYIGEIESDKIPEKQRSMERGWWKGEFERKIMFIVGAGASAHCVPSPRKSEFKNDLLSPPMGNGLFSKKFRNIYDNYEGVRQSLFDLQREDANIEEYLEDEWSEVLLHGNQEVMCRHINIQFYLQELLMKTSKRVLSEYYDFNLFAKLSDKLQKTKAKNRRMNFAFVSFNQDTILEGFLCKYFRMSLNGMDDYINVNESPFCLFKPHGSWNWGWQFPNKIKDIQKLLFNNNINFFKLYFEILGNHIDMVDWNGWGIELMLNEHRKGKLTIDKSQIHQFGHDQIGDFYPAILLPYRDKDEFTMPTDHYLKLRQYLTYIETLIIIGWKGNEILFNRELRSQAKRLKRIVIVDPNPSEVQKNLNGIINNPDVVIQLYKDFEDFILNGIDEELNKVERQE